MVADGVLQDALEQHGQFIGRFRSVFVDKLKHGVLHYIQRHVLVPYRKQRLFVGAALGLGEKSGKFVVVGQVKLLYMVSREYYQITASRV